MSDYSLTDFEESLGSLSVADIDRVVAAWGGSPSDYASWEGGFLLALRDGRFMYVTGWCDTSGWGCQDGRAEEYFDASPELATLTEWAGGEDGRLVDIAEWDLDPADLNRYVQGEIDGRGNRVVLP